MFIFVTSKTLDFMFAKNNSVPEPLIVMMFSGLFILPAVPGGNAGATAGEPLGSAGCRGTPEGGPAAIGKCSGDLKDATAGGPLGGAGAAGRSGQEGVHPADGRRGALPQ